MYMYMYISMKDRVIDLFRATSFESLDRADVLLRCIFVHLCSRGKYKLMADGTFYYTITYI